MRMINEFLVGVLLLGVGVPGHQTNQVNSLMKNLNVSFAEEAERGFTSISTAVGQFEATFQKKVNLPTVFPFEFTQKRGRVLISQNKLEIRYFNENTNEILLLFVEPMTKPCP